MGQNVLISVLSKRLPARDQIGDFLVAKRLLDNARLMVAAIQHGVIRKQRAVFKLMRQQPRGDGFGFDSSSLHCTTVSKSPWPSLLHNCFSNSFGLLAITLLAARKMRSVER